ncbi:CPBP family intramembrane metalloprotease [Nocardioides islandensis]|uniref:CPBP family intramembrane metalloprotease n=1 Tax=Nocardioides islandensis TaxID=433663 RepID=A0A930VGS5_9ACTN|nr:type II CAAX endopeptidase family protein [Nocardioides islandensis]MBF4764495.1 CPBP family intramembrane metalloprotease [Nocardioides islandensis]
MSPPSTTVENRRASLLWWSGLELTAAVVAVALDLLVPAFVIVAVSAVSLALRRQRPDSLGFHRLPAPVRTAGTVALLVLAWSVAQVGLVMPVLERVTGETQDFGLFADLEGDVGLLLVLLAASWTLGALVEETAFRGLVVTRLTEVLGGGAPATWIAVLGAALLFAAIHTEQGVVGLAVTFLDGLFFGWLRFHYRSLWAAVLAHGFSNTLGLLVFFTWGTVGGLW